ncbi:DUF6274 family protein [Streptomyces chryseus]|uniref:Uncharacterized protein n=1 Tax=Streptomyces chryseus TaxID=68186 RepID=A0ABQ3E3A2_9ACTN|nr:DUF6274 family protein [Streptomyces chryseus]GHB24297.1 hypothetical protein GCM10010346_55070 [Streptomyces chryseus]
MAASTARHETRALLRAHLAASTGYRHLTRHCPICHRLLRLAMEPEPAKPARPVSAEGGGAGEPAADAEESGPPDR